MGMESGQWAGETEEATYCLHRGLGKQGGRAPGLHAWLGWQGKWKDESGT